MAFTFKGTYTKNRGDAVAAGTVDIVSKRGVTLDTATLDENGSYELVISAEEGEVTVVETLDGVEARSYPVSVSRGSTTDTSRDIGYVGPAAQSGASDLSAYEGEVISLTSMGEDGVTITAHGDGVIAQMQTLDEAETHGSGVIVEIGAITVAANDANSQVTVQAGGAGGSVTVSAGGAGGSVALSSGAGQVLVDDDGVGFNGATTSIPVIPATPDAQDIADVLVALGLATQAP